MLLSERLDVLKRVNGLKKALYINWINYYIIIKSWCEVLTDIM